MPDTTTTTTTTRRPDTPTALDRPDDPTHGVGRLNPGEPRPTGRGRAAAPRPQPTPPRTTPPTPRGPAVAAAPPLSRPQPRRPSPRPLTPKPGTSAPLAGIRRRVRARSGLGGPAPHPGTTAADLADTSGVARSTVAKLLAAWSEDGSAISAAGATARAGRRWTSGPVRTATTPDRPVSDPDGHPDGEPGSTAPRPCLRQTRRGQRSGRARCRRSRPAGAARNRHAGSTQPTGQAGTGIAPGRAAGRGSAAGDGPGLPERAPRRARPDRDRPRVRTFLGRDRQCAQTPRRRRLGRAHQGPTPALPQHRTSRHHRARDREHTPSGTATDTAND